MKMLRHPPSKELWKFCMERLRELRGPDTRERDLANILGFEHSRAVRWKGGQVYVDRAQRRCRVVAGTSTVTDAVEKPALMAGAANVTLFPFASGLFESELDRLEERLGPRKAARR